MSDRLALPQPTWLDRAIGFVSPEQGLRRMRARVATDLVVRHYEAVSASRRTQGWNRAAGDANAVTGPALARLRTAARDLVRNNGHAKKARNKIAEHVVGWGIGARPQPKNAAALETWKSWAESTDCDADGRLDFYGIQKLAMRTIVESGEVLIRRRFRLPEDGLAIPMQLQVLEPDFLDTLKNETRRSPQGAILSRTVHGVEFDALGRRAAYWLFPEHPGSLDISGIGYGAGASRRIPAESMLHVYLQERPGQVRGASWFAASLLKFKDFDEYADATLMKQKIAACLAVITTDADGSAAPLGMKDSTISPETDSLEPGMILNVPPGRDIQVVEPPSVREYGDFSRITLHEIAAGLGTTYEDLTGDYSQVNFSSARMSRLSHWDQIHDWRWDMLIPQLCDPVWAWAMEAAGIMGLATAAGVRWTPPPMAMIEPDKEGLAHQRNIRNGTKTWRQVIRELGEDPDEVLAEMSDTNEQWDKLGLVLDCDPRKTSQAGLTQARATGTVIPSTDVDPEPPEPPPAPKPAAAPADDDEDEDEMDEDEMMDDEQEEDRHGSELTNPGNSGAGAETRDARGAGAEGRQPEVAPRSNRRAASAGSAGTAARRRVQPRLVEARVAGRVESGAGVPRDGLTPRQAEVLEMLKRGVPASAIARHLGVNRPRVYQIIEQLRAKGVLSTRQGD